MLRILVVEDEAWIALDLEAMITEIVPAVVIIETSAKRALEAISGQHFDFAFLDVDVTNGKTHKVPVSLQELVVPFAFVSGSRQNELPEDLQGETFIHKPFERSAIHAALQQHLVL